MSASGPGATRRGAVSPARAPVYPDSLAGWLERIERLHPREIDLGLERIAAVADRLGVDASAARVITVAGTNGKGSVCAMLEAMLSASGRIVGLYTSPHLVRFNERIRIDGREGTDEELREAFERVEAARGDTSLTFFEFGTLAAFDLFRRAGVDVWILEVGLGGRLDATNVIDADTAVVTSVGLDHVEWLGDNRDTVGREKAGIGRRGRPLIVGDTDPPAGLVRTAEEIGASLVCVGVDFDLSVRAHDWDWSGGAYGETRLPMPAMTGGYQVVNAAVALAALRWSGIDCGRAALEQALRTARVAGRFEIRSGDVETILDVAHNPDAAAMLARALRERACDGRTFAVIAMYADKDADGVVGQLADEVHEWCAAGLPGTRGRGAEAMADAIRHRGLPLCTIAGAPADAWQEARSRAADGDRIVVLGSFVTVASVAAQCLY